MLRQYINGEPMEETIMNLSDKRIRPFLTAGLVSTSLITSAAFGATAIGQSGTTANQLGAPTTSIVTKENVTTPAPTTNYPTTTNLVNIAAGSGLASSRLAVNIEGQKDWNRTMMFTNLMKTSRGWGLPNEPWKRTATSPRVDAQGWPLEDAGVVVYTRGGEEPKSTPGLAAGIYQVSFTGTAKITVGSKNAEIKNIRRDDKNNKTTAELHIPNNITSILYLKFAETRGGVKDVQIIRPGYQPGQVFTKEFLTAIQPFGALRLMGYFNTNGNPIKNWADRTTPKSATYSGSSGGSLEDAIYLANSTGKDIWINIPVEATDDYILKTAEMLKRDLNPRLHVYVEYSNELWNWGYPDTTINMNLAVKEVIAGDTTLTGRACTQAMFDNKICNAGWAGYNRVVKRTVEISKIFAKVFGQNEINNRARIVLASQFEYKNLGEGQMRFFKDTYKEPKKYIYGIAGAPYLALGQEVSQMPGLTKNKILETFTSRFKDKFIPLLFDEGVDVNKVFKRGTPYKGVAWSNPSQLALARYYGVKSLAYEAGLDYAQNKMNPDVKYESAISDQRIANLEREMIGQWFGCGNDLYAYFTLASGYGQSGYWGSTNDIRNLNTPRYRMVKELGNTSMKARIFTECK